MKTSLHRRWARGFLAALLLLLTAAAAAVAVFDPCFYYRLPPEGEGIYFSERCQMAGLIRNVPADTVVMGTSMAANYRKSHIEEVFGGTGLRVTIPDGYLSEFDQAMSLLFREQSPERVLFGLDLNILVRDESGLTASMPGYLYDANPLNDLQYLLNKDMLYYSVYAPLARGWGEGQTLDEGFTWDEGIWWNHMTAMENYHRPDIAAETLPPDAFRENVAENFAVVRGWIEAHPEVDFRFFLPPYSILFWDRYGRLGEEDAYFDAIAQVCETLLPYENVRLYGFLMDGEIVEDLDNYCDYIHHSGDVSDTLLRKIAAGEDELTAENWETTVSAWREHVDAIDFERYWTDAFWWKWTIDHGGEVKWKPGSSG